MFPRGSKCSQIVVLYNRRGSIFRQTVLVIMMFMNDLYVYLCLVVFCIKLIPGRGLFAFVLMH